MSNVLVPTLLGAHTANLEATILDLGKHYAGANYDLGKALTYIELGRRRLAQGKIVRALDYLNGVLEILDEDTVLNRQDKPSLVVAYAQYELIKSSIELMNQHIQRGLINV